MKIAINHPRSFKSSHLAGWFLKDQHWQVITYDDEPPTELPDWVVFSYRNTTDNQQLVKLLNWASNFSVNVQITCDLDHDITDMIFDRSYTNYVQLLQHTNLYGSREESPVSVVQSFIKQAEYVGKIEITDQYKKIKQDLMWVGDLCKIHVNFIKNVKGSGWWEIGSGIQHNLEDLAEEVAELFDAKINYVDHAEYYKNSKVNLSKLKETMPPGQMLNVYQWIEYQAKY